MFGQQQQGGRGIPPEVVELLNKEADKFMTEKWAGTPCPDWFLDSLKVALMEVPASVVEVRSAFIEAIDNMESASELLTGQISICINILVNSHPSVYASDLKELKERRKEMEIIMAENNLKFLAFKNAQDERQRKLTNIHSPLLHKAN